jgi:hypothetical protein
MNLPSSLAQSLPSPAHILLSHPSRIYTVQVFSFQILKHFFNGGMPEKPEFSFPGQNCCGNFGNRTQDPMLAKHMLCHLS